MCSCSYVHNCMRAYVVGGGGVSNVRYLLMVRWLTQVKQFPTPLKLLARIIDANESLFCIKIAM